MHLGPSQLIPIVSWIINLLLFTPVEIIWFMRMWTRRKDPFISKRRPQMLLMSSSILWITHILSMSEWIIYSFDDAFNGPIWDPINFYGVLATDLLWTIFIGIRWECKYQPIWSSPIYLRSNKNGQRNTQHWFQRRKTLAILAQRVQSLIVPHQRYIHWREPYGWHLYFHQVAAHVPENGNKEKLPSSSVTGFCCRVVY